MRNWNFFCMWWLRQSWRGFQPTYEELKLPYPSSACLTAYWFSAYLWGIETRPKTPWPRGQGRFQPTYEELKPLILDLAEETLYRFSAYLWGIETDNNAHHQYKLLCFQPTYEELKQNVLKHFEKNESVFSLPMRNWNGTDLFAVVVGFLFSAYLWGIETPEDRDRVMKPDVFSAYLWGIETQTFIVRCKGCTSVFSLPMGNWNPAFPWKDYTAGYVFSLPMRNWNRILTPCPFLHPGVFSLPMRNWNIMAMLTGWNRFKFSAYLWGIET